jgi:hypothetical protein
MLSVAAAFHEAEDEDGAKRCNQKIVERCQQMQDFHDFLLPEKKIIPLLIVPCIRKFLPAK